MWAGSSFPNPLYLFIEYKILNKKTKKNNFKNVLFTFNKLKKYKTTTAQEIEKKYGQGTVNLESGEFIKA